MEDESIKNVRSFWEKNPLFKGESDFKQGTAEYFKEHRRVVIKDCFAGCLDKRLLPEIKDGITLDLGCGPGQRQSPPCLPSIEVHRNRPHLARREPPPAAAAISR